METTVPTGDTRPGANPSTDLNELLMEIAEALGQNPREVSLQLNRLLGVSSRINQNEETIRGAVALAQGWLTDIRAGATAG